ncbi:protein kinase, partial [Nocardia sp. NPDC057030]
PGLAIGIAGPGASVVVDGVTGPTCSGGVGFAGDFQTFQGCLSLG